MIGLNALFWTFVILFAVIGSLRGWAKELLVTFAIILSLFIISVLESFVPFIQESIVAAGGTSIFWFRTGVLAFLVFFGYQTPSFPRISETQKFIKEKLQDSLLGFFLGAINAYLFWGSIWFYLDEINYAFPVITAPLENTAVFEATAQMMPLMAPFWIGAPVIYFAVAVAFAFLLVVFL